MAVQRPSFRGAAYIPKKRGAMQDAVAAITNSFVSEYEAKKAAGGAKAAILEEAKMNTIDADEEMLRQRGFLNKREAAEKYAKLERIVLREDVSVEAAEKLYEKLYEDQKIRAEQIEKGSAAEAYGVESNVMSRLESRPSGAVPAAGNVIEETLDEISSKNDKRQQDELRVTGPSARTGFQPGTKYNLLTTDDTAMGGLPATEQASAGAISFAKEDNESKDTFDAYYQIMVNYGDDGIAEYRKENSIARKRINAGESPATVFADGSKRLDDWKNARMTAKEKRDSQKDKLSADLERTRVRAQATLAAAKQRAKAAGDKNMMDTIIKAESLMLRASQITATLSIAGAKVEGDPKMVVGKMMAEKKGLPNPLAGVTAAMQEATSIQNEIDALQPILDAYISQAGYPARTPPAAPGGSVKEKPPIW